MVTYFLDHNIEEGRGSKTAIYYRDEKISYAEVARRTNQAANILTGLGLRMEERVLNILPDCPEFAYFWFGEIKAGAIAASVNTILTEDDYDYYLNYTRAAFCIVHPSAWEKVKAVYKNARFLKGVILLSEEHDPANKIYSYYKIRDQYPTAFETAPTTEDDMAVWLFTSGTTGKAKAAMHFHHDFVFNTENYAKNVLQIRESDITASVPKLFFGYATGTNLMFPFAVGASTVLFDERSTPDKLFEVIEKYRPTIITNVPTMINAMLQHPEQAKFDLSSVRLVLSAGEALPEELYRRWKDRTGVEILDGIGSAEMFHIYISNYPNDVKPGSLGKLVPGYTARIVGPDGNDVKTGDIGTLHICGDSAALGYFGDHKKSKATFAGDWNFTEDQFSQDADGYFYYHGRKDDMLKVSGIFVSPLEIENCLLTNEAIAECAVIGVEDTAGMTKTKAYIVLTEGMTMTQEEVVEHVKKRLAPYKYPRMVEFVPFLPKNERGKVDRKAIRQTFAK
jgi:benzoate-CoA ligase